jgi:hypothetical protein
LSTSLIDFNRAALNAIHAKLIDWGIAPDAFAWPPRHNPKALPYPGLDAFDEYSAGQDRLLTRTVAAVAFAAAGPPSTSAEAVEQQASVTT